MTSGNSGAGLGSPPPMRGKDQACSALTIALWDHPRLCGEKEPLVSIPVQPQGSPPPMRGKGKISLCTCSKNRITPAYAGKSNGLTLDSPLLKDHPRLCGEKISVENRWTPIKGSPPPMRGKGFNKQLKFSIKRITPAYAGKSLSNIHEVSHYRDHPRLCGEKNSAVIF